MNSPHSLKPSAHPYPVEMPAWLASRAWLARFVWTWQTTEAWRAVFAFLMPSILYLYTAAPTIYNLDSAELTTATISGGLMRATGYPLYLLLGRIWAFLPLGDMGYRMNLFSAFNGALTVLLVERILFRLKVGPWASLAAVSLLATAPFFWSLSLVAEVYTLHTALMGIILLLLLKWGEQPLPRTLFLITLLLGLSMGHHLATALLVPGAIWYVFVTHPRQVVTPRSIALALTGAGVGLCIYLLLPLRYLTAPAFNYAGTYNAAGQFNPVNLATPQGLWWLVTGKSFAAQMFAYHGAALWHELIWFVGHLSRAFFIVGLGPGLLGIGLLFHKNWRLAGLLTLLFACSAFFYIDYRVLDKETMFLPTYVIWALWVAMGTQWLLNWVGTSSDTHVLQVWATRIFQGVLVVSVLAAILFTGPKVDLSKDWTTRIRGETILEYVEPDALVFGFWDTVPVIQYLQLVEGQRPDVTAINRFLISFEDLTAYALHEAAHRPVYINEVPLSWKSIFEIKKAGPVFQVSLPDDGVSHLVQPNTK